MEPFFQFASRALFWSGVSLAIAATPASAGSIQQAAVSPVWGSLADLAGTTWRSEKSGNLSTYEWVVPNEVLKLVYVSAEGDDESFTIRLDPSGILKFHDRAGKSTSTARAVRPGVIVFEANGYQQVMRITPKSIFQETTEDGASKERQQTLVPISDVTSAIASKRQERAEWLRAIETKKQIAEENEKINLQNWGPIASLVGTEWSDVATGTANRWYWIENGKVLNVFYRTLGKDTGWNSKYELISPGQIKYEYGSMSLKPDGSYTVRIADADSADVFTNRFNISANVLHTFTEQRNRMGKVSIIGEARVSRLLPDGEKKLLAEIEERRRQTQIAQQEAAEQQRADRGSGGGFFRALQGAIGGLQGMANTGAGMSEALVGAAIGAVAGASGVDAGTISQSISDGTVQNRQDSTAPVSGSSAYTNDNQRNQPGVGLTVTARDSAAEASAAAERERVTAAKAADYAAVRAKEQTDRAANEAKDAAWRAAQDAKMKATQSERCRRMAANPSAAARCI